MTEDEKKQILESYNQQFAALCKQRDFSESMLEHYALQIVGAKFSGVPNFYSLGERDDLADYCRQFLKFNEMYDQVCKQISACSDEIKVIKETDMK